MGAEHWAPSDARLNAGVVRMAAIRRLLLLALLVGRQLVPALRRELLQLLPQPLLEKWVGKNALAPVHIDKTCSNQFVHRSLNRARA